MLLSCAQDDLYRWGLCKSSLRATWGPCHQIRGPYLVVNVCNVHHEVDIELEVVAHNAPDDVGAHIVPGVSQMRIVIHGRSTRVPGDLLAGRVDWNKRCLRLSQGVPNFQSWELLRFGVGGRLLPWRLLSRRHGSRRARDRYRQKAELLLEDERRPGKEGHKGMRKGRPRQDKRGTLAWKHADRVIATVGMLCDWSMLNVVPQALSPNVQDRKCQSAFSPSKSKLL